MSQSPNTSTPSRAAPTSPALKLTPRLLPTCCPLSPPPMSSHAERPMMFYSLTLKLTPPPPDSAVDFDLRQEVYTGDPYVDVADQVLPTFHAYAKSGKASGPVVFVNYGRVEDYARLKEMGVNVSGTLALARYGKIFRGDIVENAYDAGATGLMIYTDWKDYSSGGGSAGWFPDDKWMPPTGVQVGSVYTGAGDPTTPGWASTGGCERLSDDEVEERDDVLHIPSLPVSWADGERIMRAIGGHMADEDWQGGGGDGPVYKVGPGPGILELSYEGKQVISTIQNIIGVIEGEQEPDRMHGHSELLIQTAELYPYLRWHKG